MQWEYAGGCHPNLSLFNWVFPQAGGVQSLHFPALGCLVLAFQPALQWFCWCVWEVMSKAGVPEVWDGLCSLHQPGLVVVRVWPWGSLLADAQVHGPQEVEMLTLCRSPRYWGDTGFWHGQQPSGFADLMSHRGPEHPTACPGQVPSRGAGDLGTAG